MGYYEYWIYWKAESEMAFFWGSNQNDQPTLRTCTLLNYSNPCYSLYVLCMWLNFLVKYLWFLVVKAYHRFVPHTCPNVPKRPYDRRTLEWPYFDTVIIHCARNRKRLSVKTNRVWEKISKSTKSHDTSPLQGPSWQSVFF